MEKNTDEDGLLLKDNNNADLIRAHGKWRFISKKVKKTVELLALCPNNVFLGEHNAKILIQQRGSSDEISPSVFVC